MLLHVSLLPHVLNVFKGQKPVPLNQLTIGKGPSYHFYVNGLGSPISLGRCIGILVSLSFQIVKRIMVIQ